VELDFVGLRFETPAGLATIGPGFSDLLYDALLVDALTLLI